MRDILREGEPDDCQRYQTLASVWLPSPEGEGSGVGSFRQGSRLSKT
jgi:hypothetical protein